MIAIALGLAMAAFGLYRLGTGEVSWTPYSSDHHKEYFAPVLLTILGAAAVIAKATFEKLVDAISHATGIEPS